MVHQLPELIARHQVDEVVVGEPDATHQELLRIISLCEQGGRVNIRIFPDLFQIMAAEMSIGDLNGLPLLTVRDVAMRGWKLGFKRAMDLIGSAVGLIVLSPFLLFVALLIKLDSPGSVFYAQERMGLDGKPFWCLKFRSMVEDAEKEGYPGWTTSDDPRRTKLGALLRRTDLDELPQLINVLFGEMSLVGPRPERPEFVSQLVKEVPFYQVRHAVRPGITGWAQVRYHYGSSAGDALTKLQYDLYYIKRQSAYLEISIVVKTVAVMLGFKGR